MLLVGFAVSPSVGLLQSEDGLPASCVVIFSWILRSPIDSRSCDLFHTFYNI